jgi:hypothetical protein
MCRRAPPWLARRLRSRRRRGCGSVGRGIESSLASGSLVGCRVSRKGEASTRWRARTRGLGASSERFLPLVVFLRCRDFRFLPCLHKWPRSRRFANTARVSLSVGEHARSPNAEDHGSKVRHAWSSWFSQFMGANACCQADSKRAARRVNAVPWRAAGAHWESGWISCEARRRSGAADRPKGRRGWRRPARAIRRRAHHLPWSQVDVGDRASAAAGAHGPGDPTSSPSRLRRRRASVGQREPDIALA